MTNDGLTLMERLFDAEMRKFFTQNKFERGGMCGGLFNGKILRKMLEPNMLQIMSSFVGPKGNSFISYLHSIRELYSSLVRKEFNLNHVFGKVQEYKRCFQKVHQLGLSETVKGSLQPYNLNILVAFNILPLQ